MFGRSHLPPATGGKHRGLTKVDAATGAVDSAFKVKIDASVWTLGLSGSQLFVGGNFSSVTDGSGIDVLRAKGAGVDAATGAVQAWNPNPDAGIHYLVGGGYAMAHYTGIIRDTKDLDVFVRPGECRLTVDALSNAGYRTEWTWPHFLAKALSSGGGEGVEAGETAGS